MPKGNTAQPPPDNRPGNQLPDVETAHKTRGPKPTYRPTKSIFTQESLQLQLPFPQSANYQVNQDIVAYFRKHPVERVTIPHKMPWLSGDTKEILSEIIKVARDFVIPVKNLARHLSIEVIKNYDTARRFITELKNNHTIYEADVLLDEEVDNEPTGKKVTKKCIIVNPYAIRLAVNAGEYTRKVKDGEKARNRIKEVAAESLAQGIPPAKQPAKKPGENLENPALFDTATETAQTSKNARNPGKNAPAQTSKNARNPGKNAPAQTSKNARIPGKNGTAYYIPGDLEREGHKKSQSLNPTRTPGPATAKKIDTDTVRQCAGCHRPLSPTRKSEHCRKCE